MAEARSKLDPEKLEQLIAGYLKSKKALFVAEGKSVRFTLKNTLQQMKMPFENIHTAETFEEAVELIKEHKPHLVVATKQIKSKRGIELLQEHIRNVPNREHALFLIVIEDNALIKAMAFADKDVDAVITQPCSIDSIKKSLLPLCISRLASSPEKQETYKAQGLIFLGQEENGENLLREICQKDNAPHVAPYYLAKYLIKKDKAKEALEFARQAFTKAPKDYKVLNQLFKTLIEAKEFEEAYTILEGMLSAFPMNLNQIPHYIKLCVALKKHSDILFFSNMIREYTITDTAIIKNICAGLVMAAIHLMGENDITNAEVCLAKSFAYSKPFPQIQKNIARLFMQMNLLEKASQVIEAILEEAPADPEVRLLSLECTHKSGNHKNVVGKAKVMLRDKLHSEKMFKLYVDSAMQINTPKSSVKEIAEDAVRLYPDLKDEFTKKGLL